LLAHAPAPLISTPCCLRRQEELRLRPAHFADHLCQELGFCLVRQLGVEESAAGFNRPLLVLRKPTRHKHGTATGPAHVR
jgi:hypothetical protein